MKLVIAAMAGILVLGSGVVAAGENCFYGRTQANLASMDTTDDAEPPVAAERIDPRLLAWKKQREADESAPVIHN